jgi:hypothetical protein
MFDQIVKKINFKITGIVSSIILLLGIVVGFILMPNLIKNAVIDVKFFDDLSVEFCDFYFISENGPESEE